MKRGCIIPAGTVVSRIGFISGTTPAGVPTNQFFCIVDALTRNVLAKTADDGATAWAANALKELVLSTPLTVLDDTAVYLGVSVAATTPPSLAGAVPFNTAVSTLAPIMCGASTAGLTTPASLGATAAAVTAGQILAYAYCR